MFLDIDCATQKALLKEGKARQFQCYLPLPNKGKIHLGNFWCLTDDDPRGQDILTYWDKDDLEDEIEALEHDVPDANPKDFWEAYDQCRVNPHKLEWELLSTGACLHQIKMDEMSENIRSHFYGDGGI